MNDQLDISEGLKGKMEKWGELLDSARKTQEERIGRLDDNSLIAEADQRAQELFSNLEGVGEAEEAALSISELDLLAGALSQRNLADQGQPGRQAFIRASISERLLSALAEFHNYTGRPFATQTREIEGALGSVARLIKEEGKVFGPQTEETYNRYAQEIGDSLRKLGPIDLPLL